MNHLSEEQLEGMVQGEVPESAHLTECRFCRERLEEALAVKSRLRSAFAPVRAGPELVEQIRRQSAPTTTVLTMKQERRRPSLFGTRRWAWPVLAAAAAILIIAIPVGMYLTSPSEAHAAQAALVKIHEHNLKPHGKFYTGADPEKLADYFKKELGFSPTLPQLGEGMELRGCCVAHFRNRPVGSYVVSTPRGTISVIMVADEPQTLGKIREFERYGRTFWASSFAKCNMVIVRLGDYSYCAVGEVPHEMLIQLLSQVLG